MMMSQGSSPSFATPKKKNKEMTMSQGGLSSSILCPFTNCINAQKNLTNITSVVFLAKSLSK
jgi:hypothetical protein